MNSEFVVLVREGGVILNSVRIVCNQQKVVAMTVLMMVIRQNDGSSAASSDRLQNDSSNKVEIGWAGRIGQFG